MIDTLHDSPWNLGLNSGGLVRPRFGVRHQNRATDKLPISQPRWAVRLSAAWPSRVSSTGLKHAPYSPSNPSAPSRAFAMSAILSADDLNDFISPSVACIKPVETLPDPPPNNAYEVTTEGKEAQEARTAQISLTDCLACSGCVTSAEAVLVSLQSHAEVLNALDSAPAYPIEQIADEGISDQVHRDGKIYILIRSFHNFVDINDACPRMIITIR